MCSCSLLCFHLILKISTQYLKQDTRMSHLWHTQWDLAYGVVRKVILVLSWCHVICSMLPTLEVESVGYNVWLLYRVYQKSNNSYIEKEIESKQNYVRNFNHYQILSKMNNMSSLDIFTGLEATNDVL